METDRKYGEVTEISHIWQVFIKRFCPDFYSYFTAAFRRHVATNMRKSNKERNTFGERFIECSYSVAGSRCYQCGPTQIGRHQIQLLLSSNAFEILAGRFLIYFSNSNVNYPDQRRHERTTVHITTYCATCDVNCCQQQIRHFIGFIQIRVEYHCCHWDVICDGF